MTCDVCSKPSSGPRCPSCRHTFGVLPVPTRLVRVEPATGAQTHEDRRHGWESSE